MDRESVKSSVISRDATSSPLPIYARAGASLFKLIDLLRSPLGAPFFNNPSLGPGNKGRRHRKTYASGGLDVPRSNADENDEYI